MIDSPALLADLKGQLKLLQGDLKEQAEDPSNRWGMRLKDEYAEAFRRQRTAWSWAKWRDNEIDQAAVAWIVSTTFVRFCEDNDLLTGAKIDGLPTAVGWIAGPGDRVQRAEENLTAYFRDNPTHNRRHWLHQGLSVLAAQPAGAALVDPKHNPVWKAEISPESATALISFWRRTDDDDALIHDFTDANLGTRFLGDLYQDLSEHAKKIYALLQTPVFVEEFILDHTLTPALAEFGLKPLKLIDPACGSGHFLLGAFERLNQAWIEAAPGLDAKERVRRAMTSIHGVDINPFAVAIARFRLTLAGLKAAGERSLVGVQTMGFRLAIGDSLLGVTGGLAQTFNFDEHDAESPFNYDTEDINEYFGILQEGQYHVVVGNPPYITVKDSALNTLYRSIYKTAFKEYQLTAPFMELLFRLAIRGDRLQRAGYVGQITGNGFMTQEFGKKVLEYLFGGFDLDNPVDLTDVVDTSRAHIPGHGTPTVMIFGRRRRPTDSTLRVVIGTLGEPGVPTDPARGLAWSDILESRLKPGYVGKYISVVALDRDASASFPWTLTDPKLAIIMTSLDEVAVSDLKSRVEVLGYTGQTNADGAFLAPNRAFRRRGVESDLVRDFVTGKDVRDWMITPGNAAIFPYRDGCLIRIEDEKGLLRWMWPLRTATWARATFSKKTYRKDGRTWWEWHQASFSRVGGYCITFASLATLQHFSLDRVGRVFNKHAAFIRLPDGASENDYLALLGLLNSSTATFWLKQVSRDRGNGGIGGGISDEEWEPRYEFTGTKLKAFPIPSVLPLKGGSLDRLARDLVAWSPSVVIGESRGNLAERLTQARIEWHRTRGRMIFEQEELDWETYRHYGLIDADLTYRGGDLDTLVLGQRAFEIMLARRVESGSEETAWFARHGSVPIVEVPSTWPEEYRKLVSTRLSFLSSDSNLRLLEKPTFKRRWQTPTWEELVADALQTAILDHLEEPTLWCDGQGPAARSVSELADALRSDPDLRELIALLTGESGAEMIGRVLAQIVTDDSVPYLAAYRYRPSGLAKFRDWQQTWDLQRLEDAGEDVDVPVPPRYSTADFAKKSYGKVRGDLDVPKERFILYPDLGRVGDTTPVLGWAGWSHRDQALALAREIPTQQALGAGNAVLEPMVAGLVELEPWLTQWHSDIEPQFGTSPAAVITAVVDQYLALMEKTREQVTAWSPLPSASGQSASR